MVAVQPIALMRQTNKPGTRHYDRNVVFLL
jgi:hypothetical protein